MSARGALALALAALCMLGGLALWLLSVPAWVIAGSFAVVALATLAVVRRRRRGPARQDAETRQK